MSRCIAIIPARFESSRLPGKVLMSIEGQSMLERVYRKVSEAKEIDRVIIATDNEEIRNHVLSLGAEVEMTFRSHKSGTDRCAQVARSFWVDDIVLNIQADEPFIQPQMIDQLALNMKDDDWIQIATFRRKMKMLSDIENPNNVKVVTNKQGKALYFSRSVIPFHRNAEKSNTEYYQHSGIYAFKNKVLQEITALERSMLESSEDLEQLRWLEHGYSIQTYLHDNESISVDTPEDLAQAIAYARKNKK